MGSEMDKFSSLDPPQAEVMRMLERICPVGPNYLLLQKGRLQRGPLVVEREVAHTYGGTAFEMDVTYFGEKVVRDGRAHNGTVGEDGEPNFYHPGTWEERVRLLDRRGVGRGPFKRLVEIAANSWVIQRYENRTTPGPSGTIIGPYDSMRELFESLGMPAHPDGLAYSPERLREILAMID